MKPALPASIHAYLVLNQAALSARGWEWEGKRPEGAFPSCA